MLVFDTVAGLDSWIIGSKSRSCSQIPYVTVQTPTSGLRRSAEPLELQVFDTIIYCYALEMRRQKHVRTATSAVRCLS